MFINSLIAVAVALHAHPVTPPVSCTLTNGDRVTGELVSASQSALALIHPSLGRLRIERRDVAVCDAQDSLSLAKLGGLALRPLDDRPSATLADVPGVMVMPVIAAAPAPPLERLANPANLVPLASRALPTYVSHVGWKRALGTTYMLTRGNANVSSMGFTGAVARRTDRSQISLRAKREFGSREGTSTENYLSTTLRYDVALGSNDADAKSRPSFFSEAVYEHDPFAKIGRRAVENTGVSMPLSRNPNENLALEIGTGVTSQEPTGGTSFTRIGGLLRLAGSQLFGGAHADQAVAIFPDLTGSAGHYRLTSDFNIAAPLARAIALKIGLANRYDTQPQENVRKSDTTIQSGLALEF